MADIWAFIAQDNPKAASIFIHEIQERFTPLLETPEIGPARDYLSSGLRVHFHRRYAIYYRFTEREVIIMRVVQGSRDAYADPAPRAPPAPVRKAGWPPAAGAPPA